MKRLQKKIQSNQIFPVEPNREKYRKTNRLTDHGLSNTYLEEGLPNL